MLSDEWLPRYRLLENFTAKWNGNGNGNAYDRGDYNRSFALRAVELKNKTGLVFCVVFAVTIGYAHRTQNTGQNVEIVNKRLLLHNTDDLLDVVTSLTAHVKTLNTNVADLSTQVKALNDSLARKETHLLKLETLLSNQTNAIAELHSKKPRGGSTYVRWGRKSCPGNGTKTVYSGYAGESMYSDTGAAANYICLSPNPTWDHYTDAVD